VTVPNIEASGDFSLACPMDQAMSSIVRGVPSLNLIPSRTVNSHLSLPTGFHCVPIHGTISLPAPARVRLSTMLSTTDESVPVVTCSGSAVCGKVGSTTFRLFAALAVDDDAVPCGRVPHADKARALAARPE
jgi:hypothetical protein